MFTLWKRANAGIIKADKTAYDSVRAALPTARKLAQGIAPNPIIVVDDAKVPKRGGVQVAAKVWPDGGVDFNAGYGASNREADPDPRPRCPVCFERVAELVPWGRGFVCAACAARPAPRPTVGEGGAT